MTIATAFSHLPFKAASNRRHLLIVVCILITMVTSTVIGLSLMFLLLNSIGFLSIAPALIFFGLVFGYGPGFFDRLARRWDYEDHEARQAPLIQSLNQTSLDLSQHETWSRNQLLATLQQMVGDELAEKEYPLPFHTRVDLYFQTPDYNWYVPIKRGRIPRNCTKRGLCSQQRLNLQGEIMDILRTKEQDAYPRITLILMLSSEPSHLTLKQLASLENFCAWCRKHWPAHVEVLPIYMAP